MLSGLSLRRRRANGGAPAPRPPGGSGSPAPAASLAGWKDTVALPPGQSVRFLTRFSDYADPSTPYMFHCHLLRHEDEGLMGQFVVVQPGQTPRQPPAHQHQG